MILNDDSKLEMFGMILKLIDGLIFFDLKLVSFELVMKVFVVFFVIMFVVDKGIGLSDVLLSEL